jgi:hypothetical protein
MFTGSKCVSSIALAAVVFLSGAIVCSAQGILQSIPDGTAVDVRSAGGQTRRGVVNGYMPGEYRVEFGGGVLDSEWVPEANVVPVAVPVAAEPKQFDSAPLYQAIGAATCPLAIIAVIIVLVVTRAGRRPPGNSPFQPGPLPPSP